MSTPIIVAIIAACASLIATGITLIVARQTRRVALVQDQFRLLLKLSEERITRLRAQAAATERLRASAMLLRNELESAGRSKAGSKLDRSKLHHLRDEFHAFWMRWAETKDDVPDFDLDRLRALRHHMHHVFDDTLALVEISVRRSSGQRADDERQHEALRKLSELLLLLDAFYGEIASLRTFAVETIILAEPTARASLRNRNPDRISKRALAKVLPGRNMFTPSP